MSLVENMAADMKSEDERFRLRSLLGPFGDEAVDAGPALAAATQTTSTPSPDPPATRPKVSHVLALAQAVASIASAPGASRRGSYQAKAYLTSKP